MTTVAQLIAKLQTLPQDAEVEVLREVISGYSTYAERAPIDLEWGIVFHDYTDERWKNSTRAGTKVVFLEAE